MFTLRTMQPNGLSFLTSEKNTRRLSISSACTLITWKGRPSENISKSLLIWKNDPNRDMKTHSVLSSIKPLSCNILFLINSLKQFHYFGNIIRCSFLSLKNTASCETVKPSTYVMRIINWIGKNVVFLFLLFTAHKHSLSLSWNVNYSPENNADNMLLCSTVIGWSSEISSLSESQSFFLFCSFLVQVTKRSEKGR